MTNNETDYYNDMIQYNLDIGCYTGVILYAQKALKAKSEHEQQTDEELNY